MVAKQFKIKEGINSSNEKKDESDTRNNTNPDQA